MEIFKKWPKTWTVKRSDDSLKTSIKWKISDKLTQNTNNSKKKKKGKEQTWRLTNDDD